MLCPNRELPKGLLERLSAASSGDRVVVMTGAGISAESGIPTFRGKEGYWVRGSREYHPQELATHQAFDREPETVWAWYLYRRGVCRAASPNPAHLALVELEQLLADRFLLITQNVDGLHLRAGNSLQRTYQIHGNVDYARCDTDCGQPLTLLAEQLGRGRDKNPNLSPQERDKLRCPSCAGWLRPHVLWFDECYDEQHFRFQSSLRAAASANVLLVVGTAGATNLPMQVGAVAVQGGATIVDINPERNPFSELAERSAAGHVLQGAASEWLPAFVAALARG